MLPIAPSTYDEHARRRRDPERRPYRAMRDDRLRVEIKRVRHATLEWVDWFNNRRLLGPIGYVAPGEYEAKWYEAQHGQAKAA